MRAFDFSWNVATSWSLRHATDADDDDYGNCGNHDDDDNAADGDDGGNEDGDYAYKDDGDDDGDVDVDDEGRFLLQRLIGHRLKVPTRSAQSAYSLPVVWPTPTQHHRLLFKRCVERTAGR